MAESSRGPVRSAREARSCCGAVKSISPRGIRHEPHMATQMSSLSSKPSRGAVLTVFAVLFVVLAISNFSKPFHLDSRAGFVFFGVKTSGIANDILGPAFGVWLLVYAIGIWRMRRWALPRWLRVCGIRDH